MPFFANNLPEDGLYGPKRVVGGLKIKEYSWSHVQLV
jgi:hypothetical protein